MTTVCITLGCSPPADTSTNLSFDEASLPVVSGTHLSTYVRDSELPVLVEFGVDFNCPRCQQVKSDVVALSKRLDRRVDVVRVDFNTNARLVAQLGGTICPTYVLFQNGEPVVTRSFPVSLDLIEREVEGLLAVVAPTAQ
ncbi:thioredoxin domain-containing protein [Rosistilla oblonga]|uniref:thioredoxin domain-containing protein n=1 Tax=Rosistilla oblonga TaxID=2527990 RepID=UPI0018D267AD|nr:thioredoxin domain-containing protein [Rosistilla oblonga]